MILYIKYMVSLRCKMMVREELKKLDLDYLNIDLGRVEIMGEITTEKRETLRENLAKSGLELLGMVCQESICKFLFFFIIQNLSLSQ